MKYKSLVALLIFVFNISIQEGLAQDTFIQVISEPGVSVFLDGVFQGVTSSEFNGLIIQNVEPGNRIIRVIREGYNPQEESLSIVAGEVYSHRVSPFIPAIRITERGSEGEQSIDLKIGSLKIQSLPLQIRIQISGLGINADKAMDEWIAEDIPVGRYDAEFIRGVEHISYTFEIEENVETHLFVNTLSAEVEVRTMPSLSTSVDQTDGNNESNLISSTPISTNESIACGGPVTFVYAGESVTYGTVRSATGRCWLDRNLGASRVATSATDEQAFGDLFQWGRSADGHQKRFTGRTPTRSDSPWPNHGHFIRVNGNWLNQRNDDLWQGVNGINNPCPDGYRIPGEGEWQAERHRWRSNNADGAFASPLKLPVAGRRNLSNGSLVNVGSSGFYWSGTVSDTFSQRLIFNSSNAYMSSNDRAGGYSVRCLKD